MELENKLAQDAPASPHSRKLGVPTVLGAHWPEYLMEAGLLGMFMVSACAFGALYEFPRLPVHQAIMSVFLRRFLMGISMGLIRAFLPASFIMPPFCATGIKYDDRHAL